MGNILMNALKKKGSSESSSGKSTTPLGTAPPCHVCVSKAQLHANLTCPISLEIMKDPVLVTASGITYDCDSLCRCLLNHPFLDPATGKKYDSPLVFVANMAFRSILIDLGYEYSPYDTSDFNKNYALRCKLNRSGSDDGRIRSSNTTNIEGTENLVDANEWYRQGLHYLNGSGGYVQNKDAAVALITEASDQGNAAAQHHLGFLYLDGDGVSRDYDKTVRLFKLSADQGYAQAQCNLGLMYSNGYDVPRDYDEALRLFKLAANQGYAQAQCNLGNTYLRGHGVSRDYVEAVRLFKLAADQGNAQAQCNLGFMYQSGLGVSLDNREAIRLFKLAAEQGSAVAQCNLAILYEKGCGVSCNYDEAVRFYKLAADQGNAVAQCNLAILYKKGCGISRDYDEA